MARRWLVLLVTSVAVFMALLAATTAGAADYWAAFLPWALLAGGGIGLTLPAFSSSSAVALGRVRARDVGHVAPAALPTADPAADPALTPGERP